MAGNVFNWNEVLIYLDGFYYRGVRGGAFDLGGEPTSAQRGNASFPTTENGDYGFRVASIPEPSTIMLAAVGALALFAYRRRR
jgi:hypothetical protein